MTDSLPLPLRESAGVRGGFAPGCSHAVIPAWSLLSFPTFLTLSSRLGPSCHSRRY